MKYGKHTSSVFSGGILVLSCLLMLFFSSCFKEDTTVTLPQLGGDTFFTIDMGSDYNIEYYFNLNNPNDTSGGWHADWDLAFETSDTGFHIWLNGGNKAVAADMNTTDFGGVTSTKDAVWKFDAASWYEDSTAIGDWRSEPDVYIIDRGEIFSDPDRYWKVAFQSVSATAYQMKFAHLDGSDSSTVAVSKDPSKSYVYYSFLNGGQLACPWQPNASAWNLQFTRYSYIFFSYNPPLQYPVTGVLTQPGETVAVDSVDAYDKIDYQLAQSSLLNYSYRRDAIGYNWKTYSFNTSAYTVKTYYTYIIRDEEGHYWKLHFLDFYNAQGQKGYPQFEFEQLH